MTTENKQSQAEALLKHLGLTEYESKAYITLLSNGKLNAERVSLLSGIPLPRVYDTMNGLAERGMIFITKTRPQVFQAISPNQLKQMFVEDEKKKMDAKVKAIEDSVPQFLNMISSIPVNKEEEGEDSIAYTKKRVNTAQLWSSLHGEVKKEILAFGGDMSWIAQTTDVIRKLTKRGISYKILWCKDNEFAMKNVRQALKAGVDARFCTDYNGLRGIIVDGKKVSLLQVTPKPGVKAENIRELDPDAEHYLDFTTTLINNKQIATVFVDYFKMLWEKSDSAEKSLSRLTGKGGKGRHQ